MEDETQSDSVLSTISNNRIKPVAIVQPIVHPEASIVNGETSVASMTPKRQRLSTSVSPGLKTQWGSLTIAYIILFLTGFQFSLRIASLWPYLRELDKTAKPSFFGWLVAGFSLGQLIASPIMGWIARAIKNTRYPVIFGVVLTIGGNMILCFVENFPVPWRRWVMLVARFINGIGSGTAGILRAFVAMGSTTKDKSRALALGTGSFAFGIVIGPGVSAAFAPIGYPAKIINNVHFDMYTVPGYFAAACNVISLILLVTLFKENPVSLQEGGASQNDTKNKFKVLPKMNKAAVLLCVWFWFNLIFSFTNGETIGSPFAMVMFNWNNEQTVLYNGIIQAVNGFLSVLTYAAFILYLYGKVPERPTMIVGTFFTLMFYIISYPWPGLPRNINYMPYEIKDNATLYSNFTLDNVTFTNPATTMVPVGCSTEYKWCENSPRVNIYQYIVALVFLGLGLPTVNSILTPLYAQVIGPRRQEKLQGVFVGSGSLARFIGPVFISKMFDEYGPMVPWLVTIVMTVITIVLMIAFYKILIPLKVKPKIKPGDYIRYKHGLLYHF